MTDALAFLVWGVCVIRMGFGEIDVVPIAYGAQVIFDVRF